MGFFESVHEAIRDAGKNEEQLRAVREDLAGLLFEHLAYEFVCSQNSQNLSILSPDETVGYYKRFLYPNAEYGQRRSGLGIGGLHGITVPDGLALDSQGKIIAVYHYTSRHSVWDVNHLVGMYRVDRKKSTIFTRKSELHIVTLKGAGAEISSRGQVIHDELPIDRNEFHELFTRVWQRCG